MHPISLETDPSVGLAPGLTGERVVVAVTDDGRDPRYAVVRDAAARLVAADGLVLLFHVTSGDLASGGGARSFVPPATPGDGAVRPHTGSRRCDLLRTEAELVRARGARVAVWLARSSGPGALLEAVERSGAELVLVPAGPEHRATGCPRIDRTLAYYASRIGTPVMAVDPAGRVTAVAPLGSVEPATLPTRIGGALAAAGSPR